jgi:hypothetical protein
MNPDLMTDEQIMEEIAKYEAQLAAMAEPERAEMISDELHRMAEGIQRLSRSRQRDLLRRMVDAGEEGLSRLAVCAQSAAGEQRNL